MSLRFTKELYAMTMKNDTKFDKKLTCRFKINMTNLTKYDQSSWKPRRFSFSWDSFEQSV